MRIAVMRVVLFNNFKKKWMLFKNPVSLVTANDVNSVLDAVKHVQYSVLHDGFFAAGYI